MKRKAKTKEVMIAYSKIGRAYRRSDLRNYLNILFGYDWETLSRAYRDIVDDGYIRDLENEDIKATLFEAMVCVQLISPFNKSNLAPYFNLIRSLLPDKNLERSLKKFFSPSYSLLFQVAIVKLLADLKIINVSPGDIIIFSKENLRRVFFQKIAVNPTKSTNGSNGYFSEEQIKEVVTKHKIDVVAIESKSFDGALLRKIRVNQKKNKIYADFIFKKDCRVINVLCPPLIGQCLLLLKNKSNEKISQNMPIRIGYQRLHQLYLQKYEMNDNYGDISKFKEAIRKDLYRLKKQIEKQEGIQYKYILNLFQKVSGPIDIRSSFQIFAERIE